MRRDRRSDQQLLRATRGGDADAFGEFFARYGEVVLSFLRRRVDGAELAAELTAETFAAALVAVHDGRAEEVSNGTAWLLGIARHKLIDTYRSARVQDAARAALALPRLAIEDTELERIDELAGAQRSAVAALAHLSADEREAIVDRILREREYQEIAGSLGQHETTIRKRVSRGLTRLRQQIGAQLP